MANEWLTDTEVEREIEVLRTSPMVQLARKEERLKYKRRQVLYQLRNLENVVVSWQNVVSRWITSM